MVDSVFSGAEHHLALVAAGQATQIAQEFIAVHHRHVPVEQDRIGQAALLPKAEHGTEEWQVTMQALHSLYSLRNLTVHRCFRASVS